MVVKPNEPFLEFPKIPRLNREVVVTEKLDGTNATVFVAQRPDGSLTVHAGSKNRWIDEQDDNHGFAKWVQAHAEGLKALGLGLHRGEWHGPGIGRNYGLKEKRFSLFNTSRWTPETPPPTCCSIVPVLYRGPFSKIVIDACLDNLRADGSVAYPGHKAEGIVIFHAAGNLFFKATCERDDAPKGYPR